MAFRGGGRVRWGGPRSVLKGPFELFPQIENLPDVKNVKEELALAVWSNKLQRSWNSSPYYYEGVGKDTKGSGNIDIERYSDKDSEKIKRRAPLSNFIMMTDEYVPAELAEKRQHHGQKRVRWNPETDLSKLDLFEKLEKKYQGREGKEDEEKKEGEGEDDERISGSEDEYSDDFDYNQAADVDDDEDDFNMPDDNDEEPCY